MDPRLSLRPWRTAASRIPAPLAGVLLVYGGLGLLLWMAPLFNLLHAESSAVVAGVGFFAAGLSSVVLFGRGGGSFRRVLVQQEAGLLLPWLLLTFTLLWVPNCGYGQGVLFFILFAPPSVALAVAVAYALSATRRRFKKTTFLLLGLAVAVIGPLYDLGFHPQFYVYNHVFGGVLGPIYDEELTIRPGLVLFRGLTLLWALLAYLIGRRLRRSFLIAAAGRESDLRGIVAVVVVIGVGYLFAVPLGFNTAEGRLQRALGGLHQTEHFDIYYDPASLEADAVRRLAEDHEFRYAQLAARLETGVPARIASYLYPDADTKARLTGARTTNVAPVWLRRPQVHVLLPVYERVFAHELAHVFSRAFGLPLLRASLSVGLVEGLAVALEPPDGLPTPHEQVAAATMQRLAAGRAQTPSLAANLAARLSPLGFWTGRGAVSYTTMGSFVRYLLDAYGPGPLKQVYARADFEKVYGKPVGVLAQQWEDFVLRQPVVDRAAGSLVAARFSIPSLFEKRCPHYVPAYRRFYQEGLRALAAHDSAYALSRFEAALRWQPAYEPAQTAWAHLMLAEGAPAPVLARLDTVAADRLTPALAVRLGDAHALLGRPETARTYYEAALKRLPSYAQEAVALVVMRKSLADDTEILHLLTAGGAPEERARRVATREAASPASAGIEAFLWAAAGHFEQAAGRLDTVSVFDDEALSLYRKRVLRWQSLVWRARWSYQAGRLETAAGYAARAARAYREAGALNAAALADDFAAKMAWLRQADETTFRR
jgi:hypothetical protein